MNLNTLSEYYQYQAKVALCMKCPDVEEYPMCALRCDRTEADIENIIRRREGVSVFAMIGRFIGGRAKRAGVEK